MKSIYSLLILFLPFVGFGQNNNVSYLNISENNEVILCKGDTLFLYFNNQNETNIDINTHSLNFNQGQYFRVPMNESLSNFNDFTLEFWYYQTGFSGGDEKIVGTEFFSGSKYSVDNQHGDWSSYLNDGSNSSNLNYWNSEDNTPTIIQNTWHHFAICRNSDTSLFYLNGELLKEEIIPLSGIGDISQDLVINRHTWNGGSSSRLSGHVDELRISNICRYQSDFEPPLFEFVDDEYTRGLWHFNNSSNDESGFENNGATIGATFSNFTPFNDYYLLNNTSNILWSNNSNEDTSMFILENTDTFFVSYYINGELFNDSILVNVDTQNHIIEVASCDSFEWNGETYTESGVYEYSEQNNNEFSMSFDGTSNFVEISNYNPLGPGQNNFTIGAWVKFNELGTDVAIYDHTDTDGNISGNNSRLNFRKNNFDQLHLSIKDSTANNGVGYYTSTSIITITDFNWHHVSVTFDYNNMMSYFYLDGQLINNTVTETPLLVGVNPTGNIQIGKYGDATFTNATIDDVYIWHKMLTNQEILDYMNCPPVSNEEGLVGYWNFEEGEGETVIDLSENENDGIINGATYSTDVPEQSCQLTTVNGCDSVAVLNLVITASDTSFTDVSSCESYEWNGEAYTESGIYEYSEQNNNEYSMSFDGDSDSFQLENTILFGTNSFTVSIDCYLNSFEGSDNEPYSYIVGTPLTNNTNDHGFKIQTESYNLNGGFAAHINDAGTNEFNTISYNNTIQDNVQLNKWYNLTMVVDRINYLFKFYVDGNLVGTQDISASFGDVDLGIPISIGNMSFNNTSLLDGSTDNLHIWSKALSENEILRYLHCPPIGTEDSLIGYWNFEEGEGNIVYDLSGNENHGTIDGTTYSTDVPEQSCQLTNVNGCDSLAVLNLTISQPDTSITEVTACESYEWNGETYTESGTYEYSEQNNNEYSMSFDGVDDYINSSLNSTLSPQDATWMVWCYFSDLNVQSGIIAQNNGYNTDGFYINTSNVPESQSIPQTSIYLSTAIGNTNQLAQTWTNENSISANQWHHIAISLSNGIASIYIDGTYNVAGNNFNHLIQTSNTDFLIGCGTDLAGAVTQAMNGKIDDLSVWNISLTQQQIQNYMNCPPTGYESGLVGYWNFEEGETVIDLSGNGNDATINGATHSSDVPEQSCQLTTTNGCDSVAVLNLTITQPDTSFIEITACESHQWNGTTYDSSGTYDYSGTTYNNNFSLGFNNQNDWISIPPINTGNNYTLQIWAEFPLPTTLDGHNTFFSDWNTGGAADIIHLFFHNICGLGIGDQYASGNCNVSGVYGTGFSASSVSNGWHLISVISEPNQTTFYIDNQSVGSVNHSVSSPIVAIGNNAGSNGVAAQNVGNIDMPTIWNYSLSTEEIEQYMNCPPTGSEAGLISFWDLEEGIGNTALNQTGNANNGIINGATYNSNVPSEFCQLINLNGCDSIAILDLTINNSDNISSSITACDEFTWGGQTYTVSGEYTNTYSNISGCDSTHTLNLTINYTTYGTDTQEHCDIYTWIDGNTYTESNNTATFTITNTNNCDSVVTLDLIINNSDNTSSSITACDEFTWDGQTYTESGEYTNTYSNISGCDSTHTLNLTINYTTYGTNTQDHCDTYTWIDGNTYTESNNTATFTITNTNNCDSIVTLDLIINNSDNTSSSITACDEFTWDGQTYTESGEYTNTYSNISGCDSTHTLNLTINYTNYGTDTQEHCDTYTWIDGNTYIESNNTATFTITNTNNCDSVVTLDLIINQSTSSYDTVIVCDTYEWNDTNYFESGNYVYTSTNVNGCDSLANLDLTISQLVLLSINGDQVGFTETENNIYSIPNSNVNSTYYWSLSNNVGIIYGGNANNSEIIITWGENDSETILCVFEEDEFGCQGEESCITVDVKRPSSIKDSEKEVLSVYPNPFTNQTTVSFYNPTQSKASLKLIDSRGRIVREYNNILSNKIIINKEELSVGLYNVVMKLNDHIIKKSIVIQ